MDISMGIRPEYEHLSHAPKIKAIKEIFQTNPTQLSPDKSTIPTRGYQDSYPKNHHQRSGKHETKVLAKFVMNSPVVTLASSTKVEEAKDLIRQHHYHHFPVVDSQQKITGILTDRDLLRNSPNLEHRSQEIEGTDPLKDISALMSTKLVVAYANTPLSEIGKAMLAENIKCVPIIDQEHQVMGMVTSSDFIRCVIQHHEVDEQG
jgi:acetoin utilization protein AcuB